MPVCYITLFETLSYNSCWQSLTALTVHCMLLKRAQTGTDRKVLLCTSGQLNASLPPSPATRGAQ